MICIKNSTINFIKLFVNAEFDIIIFIFFLFVGFILFPTINYSEVFFIGNFFKGESKLRKYL